MTSQQPTQINVFIRDKYAAKYSTKILSLALLRARSNGYLGALTLWIAFLVSAIVLDYLKYDYYLLKASTYEIIHNYDMGLVANLSLGRYGWSILFATLLLVVAFNLELLFSRYYVCAAVSSIFIISAELTVIVLAYLKVVPDYDIEQGSQIPIFKRLNLAFISALSVAWPLYHSVELVMTVILTRRLGNMEEFPKETTLVSKVRLVDRSNIA